MGAYAASIGNSHPPHLRVCRTGYGYGTGSDGAAWNGPTAKNRAIPSVHTPPSVRAAPQHATPSVYTASAESSRTGVSAGHWECGERISPAAVAHAAHAHAAHAHSAHAHTAHAHTTHAHGAHAHATHAHTAHAVGVFQLTLRDNITGCPCCRVARSL